MLLGCRDLGKGEAACNALRAEGLPVRPVELDTTSAASVTRLAEMIQQGYGHLDALVNNAGIGVDHDPMLTAADRLRRTMSVNVLRPLLLTGAMVPLLKRRGAAASSTSRPSWRRSVCGQTRTGHSPVSPCRSIRRRRPP